MRSTAILLAALLLIAAPVGVASADLAFKLFNTGCKVNASKVNGCVFGSTKGPGYSGKLARGSREGRACGWNLLALISVGDVRITTAMRNGGISHISAVDYYSFELLPGFYGFSRYCTVVSGE
jgi:hypothetical protein